MTLVVVAALTDGCQDKTGPARLVIHEQALKSKASFTEGAIGFLSIRRADDGTVVFNGRYGYRRSGDLPFQKIPIHFDRSLPAGRYRIVSYVRSCPASCGDPLDPPSDRCEKPLELKDGQRVDVTLFTVVLRPCRFSVE